MSYPFVGDESSPMLQAVVGEKFTQVSGGILPLVAPVHATQALSSQYNVAVTKNVIKEEESGYDPKVPQSRRAPHREISRPTESRTFDVKLHKHFEFIDRITMDELKIRLSADGVQQAMGNLAKYYRDLMEWEVADFYRNPDNYGNTDTFDLNGDPADLLASIDQAVDAVRSSNYGDDDASVTLVVSKDVLRKLQRVMAPVLGNSFDTYITNGQFQPMLVDKLSTPVNLFVPSSQYEANKTEGEGQYLPMWGDNLFAVAGISSNIGYTPGFAHTLAESATSDSQDESNIFQLWTEEIKDPRGVKVLAECNFKVNSGSKDRGFLFNVTE